MNRCFDMQNRCLAGLGWPGWHLPSNAPGYKAPASNRPGFARVTHAVRAAFLFMGLAFCFTSQAQVEPRQFPPAALRGILVVTQPPQVTLNGLPTQLSPGARIRAPSNLLVLSGTLLGQSLLVNYALDAQGQIHEVWILTAAEAQEPRAGMPSYFQSNTVVPGQAR